MHSPRRLSYSIFPFLVDIKPFYIEEPLEDALKAFPTTEEGLDSFIELFRGVRCTLRDDQTRSFVVDGWT